MLQPIAILEHRLANRLAAIVEGCDALNTDGRLPQETECHVDNEYLRQEVIEAAHHCAQLGLHPEASQLRISRFRNFDYTALGESARSLLRTINGGVRPADTDQQQVSENGDRQTKAKAKGSNPGVQRRRGRPVHFDPKKDKQLVEAWNTGAYKSRAELANEFRMSLKDVIDALERQRKHRERANSPSDK